VWILQIARFCCPTVALSPGVRPVLKAPGKHPLAPSPVLTGDGRDEGEVALRFKETGPAADFAAGPAWTVQRS
jgi:hypothetical protein